MSTTAFMPPNEDEMPFASVHTAVSRSIEPRDSSKVLWLFVIGRIARVITALDRDVEVTLSFLNMAHMADTARDVIALIVVQPTRRVIRSNHRVVAQWLGYLVRDEGIEGSSPSHPTRFAPIRERV